jgi:stage III sporulation protein AB
MDAALECAGTIPRHAYRNLKILGKTLGQFDADGQVRSLESVKVLCQRDLAFLQQDRENHLRSYRTLGLCAGIVLVIILI